jgi:carboxyl-terminal processing protease
MKENRTKYFFIGIAITAFAAISLTNPIKEDYFEMSKQLEIMNSAFKELNVYYVDPLSPGELIHTGIDAMLESLDPYTRYYPEEKMEDVRFISTGEYGGVGLSLKKNWDGGFIIIDLIEGGPAEKAGIELGDRLVSIKGIDLKNEEIDDIGKQIKGTSGTDVELGIISPGELKPVSVTLTRQKIKRPDIPYFGMLNENTGYLILSKFTKTASTEVRAKLIHLTDSMGATSIVFDLRGNGGGLLREAVNIVNLFVPKGTEVVAMKGKTEAWNKNYGTLRRALLPEIPLAILIDDRSASASEIVAGALQELDRAVIIGRESFGKGLVQQTKTLAYGSRMKITVAKYYTPSGRCVQRLQYGDRDENGDATISADSTLKIFYTTNGRPVIEGRGVFPDVEIESEFSNYVLNGLLENNVLFDFAITKKNLTINNPESFSLSSDLWEEFISFTESAFSNDEREFPYSPNSTLVIDVLEAALESDGLLDTNRDLLAALESTTATNLRADIKRNEELIRRALEEEFVFHKANTSGLFEYQLPKDSNALKAIELLETGEYKDILVGPTK